MNVALISISIKKLKDKEIAKIHINEIYIHVNISSKFL